MGSNANWSLGPPLLYPEASFSGNQGTGENPPTSQLPAWLMAPELPSSPSHTSLHFCKALGDVRSFFQLLQVSIKLAADSSLERGAAVRRKHESRAVPPPHGFPGEEEQLPGWQEHPGLCQGLSPVGDPEDGEPLPPSPMNTQYQCPQLGSCSRFTGSHHSLGSVERSEDGETFSSGQRGSAGPEAPWQSLCPAGHPCPCREDSGWRCRLRACGA